MSSITAAQSLQNLGPARVPLGKPGRAFARVCMVHALIFACAWLPDARAAAIAQADDATRAAVQDELAAYRCAGYNPVADEINYPADVEAARDRLNSSGCEPAAGKRAAAVNGPAKQRDAQTR
jgi:hypothetical protein